MSDLMLRAERTSRTKRRRARKRKRGAMRAASLIGLGLIVAAGAILLVTRPTSPTPPPALGDVTDGEQLTLLVASTLVSDVSSQADALTLFGVDRTTGADPVALFIPTGTFGQIPGQSSIEEIGKALTFGRAALQETTVENLLGIVIDRTVVISDVEMARFIERLGGITVSVTDRITEQTQDGATELVFPLGEQPMDGPEAVTYLTYRGEGESQLDRAVRAQQVWQAIMAVAVEDETALRAAALEIDGLGPGEARALADVLVAFGRANDDDRTFDALAVESVGGASIDEVYRLDPAGVAAQIEDRFADSIAPLFAELGERPKVELRNGVGVPEVGATAAALLVPRGFKIEVTGNTRRFDTDVTRIVIYDDDQASMDLAEAVRSTLGVGRIEVGTRAQTVVDLTVVIGKDFVDRKA